MNPIIPEWPVPDCVKAFSTLRDGGFSLSPYHGGISGTGGLNFGLHVGDDPVKVRENRALLKKMLPSEPVWLNQIHGVNVVDAAKCAGVPDADASYTSAKNVVCVVMTADCLPVLLCASDGMVVASVHAGWRGLVAGVLEKAVEAVRKISGSEIMAWLGPAIRSRCIRGRRGCQNCFCPERQTDVCGLQAEWNEGRKISGRYLCTCQTDFERSGYCPDLWRRFLYRI